MILRHIQVSIAHLTRSSTVPASKRTLTPWRRSASVSIRSRLFPRSRPPRLSLARLLLPFSLPLLSFSRPLLRASYGANGRTKVGRRLAQGRSVCAKRESVRASGRRNERTSKRKSRPSKKTSNRECPACCLFSRYWGNFGCCDAKSDHAANLIG